MKSKLWNMLLPTMLMAVFVGCASTPPPPPANTAPIYLVSSELGGKDPVEPFNRSMYVVNEFGLRWVYRPVGYIWGSIFPRVVVTGFNNFTDNVGFPVRMFSCFLQAEWKPGGIEFARFFVNTTAGCLGFMEVAQPYFDLPRQDEDFGQAFACWGIGPGCYLFLPFYGPTNVRDGVGAIFDYAFDPKSYFYGGQAFTAVNKLSSGYGAFDDLYRQQQDPYEILRDLSLQQRYLQLHNFKPAPTAEENVEVAEGEIADNVRAPMAVETAVDAAVVNHFKREARAVGGFSGSSTRDTLDYLAFIERNQTMWPYLSLWNSNFSRNGEVRSLAVLPERDKLDYKFYLNKQAGKTAPLVVLLCGLGGHYSSSGSTAMAQLFYDQGYSVAVFSNTLNQDFLKAVTPEYCSGYSPDDAKLIARVLTLAVQDLQKSQDIAPESLVLSGYSHGALQSLFITATAEQDLPLPVSAVIAVNPPVDLIYATGKMDGFVNVAEKWSADEAQQKISDVLAKYLSGKLNSPNAVDEENSHAVVGLAFRFTLRDAIFIGERYQGIPALQNHYQWGSRYPLYIEINQLTFDWYVENVLLGYYQRKLNRPDLTVEELRKNSSLYSIGDFLANDSRVHVIHTANDFLLSDADAEFLADTCKNLILFDRGGHLGQLSRPQVQQQLQQLLPKLVSKENDETPQEL